MQEDDVLDTYVEYGTVKAGSRLPMPRRISLSLTRVACSAPADGPQNRLHQRIRFCGVRQSHQTGWNANAAPGDVQR